MEAIDSILKLSQVGALGLCLFALFGAYKGWWTPGWVYRDAQRREESWRELYEREKEARETDRGRSLDDVAERAVEKAMGRTRP